MIHLITYCNDRYLKSAHNLCRSAVKHGVDHAKIMIEADIPELYKKMIGDNINEIDRHWFYIWKPFVVWEAMNHLPDGEVLIYADAGQTIVNSVMPLIEQMDQDIMMFNNPWKHVEWCKMDVYNSIIGRSCYADEPSEKQAQASLIFFRITPEVRNFVKEWMLWCLMPGFCDNSPSKIPNYPTFAEHRYDQAVLTCLQIKYGYKLHPFPSIENMDATYRITEHHRKNNSQW